MTLTPDDLVAFRAFGLEVNATLAFSWGVMALLAVGTWAATRGLRRDRPPLVATAVEALVGFVLDQIRDVTEQDPEPYLPFVGTLFLFILTSNLLAVVPGFEPPTGSLSTTAALALCVFFAVPGYGVARLGPIGYLRTYLQPTPLMLPFKLIGEFSRTLALAVRLFGNVMSGTVIAAILLGVAPLLFPAVMQAFSLLVGAIHAYIFAILAIVYIASGTRARTDGEPKGDPA